MTSKKTITLLVMIFIIFTVFTVKSQAQEGLIQKQELANGTKVILKNDPGKEITSFTILLKLSVFDEEAYTPGIRAFLAELIESEIDSIKTENNTRWIELMGIFGESSVETDYISINVTCRSKDFPKTLDIVSKAIANPAANQDIYEKTKQKFIEDHKNINGTIDNIYSLFLTTFYRYHPYKLTNQYSLTAIERMDRKKVAEFAAKTFSSDRIVVAIAGSFDRDKAISTLTENFSAIARRNNTTTSIQWEPQGFEKQLFLSALSNKGWLIMGYSFPSYSSPDYPAMLLAKNIVGEGFNSRFWIELREKNGFAYELGAFAPPLEGPAHIMFYVILQPKNAMAARKIAFEIIEDIKKNGVTEKELAIAKEKFLGSYLLRREKASGFTHDIASSEAIGGAYSVDMNLKRKINDVSIDDIKKVANKYLTEPTIIIVRPPGLYINDTYL